MPQEKSGEERIFKYINFEIPDGFFYAPLRKNYGKVKLAHPMDDDLEGLFTIFNTKIIPICTSYCSPRKFYRQRVDQLLQHVVPAFDPCFTFFIELQYLLIVPKEQQTKENLELVKILRIICEIYFSSTSVVDDICDNSPMRMGKPAWHTICKGGSESAFYDALYLDKLASYLLEVFFGDTPGYKRLIRALNFSSANVCVGQITDILEKASLVAEPKIDVKPYKNGVACSLLGSFGLVHAGVTDESIINKVERIVTELFIAMQAWNDFNDTFFTTEITGKNKGEDIQNGRVTWCCQAALVLFNEEQKIKFLNCYGSSDERDIQTVKDLYTEINMPGKYLEFLTEKSNNIDSIIKEISREDVKRVCANIKEWFFGNIKSCKKY